MRVLGKVSLHYSVLLCATLYYSLLLCATLCYSAQLWGYLGLLWGTHYLLYPRLLFSTLRTSTLRISKTF
jgi:hypothetical protein